jgi:glutaminyl-tRNA synthetase
VEKPEADKERDFLEFVNPDSLAEATALCEPSLAEIEPGATCQFERIGYFCADRELSGPGRPVFNRTVSLRDSWAKKDK